jgi:hypothetical protein
MEIYEAGYFGIKNSKCRRRKEVKCADILFLFFVFVLFYRFSLDKLVRV